ncbi:MAG TPA: sucrase ferredoxin [Actinomycetota bacterium]|nr:sucrase ferredoxin [Actinomycetota bacterium]
MARDTFRCSDASEARDEPIYGTASPVTSWLLLEQPGSWGHDALTHSRLPERIGRELRSRAARAGVRVVLIRRGARLSTGHRQCYFAYTGDDATRVTHTTLRKLDDLLDIDMKAIATGKPILDATEQKDPLFLVCTHGRHDACCSIRGNQVSRLACALPGVDAWECSHIGGDRFAANLLCFPDGIYYGRVTPEAVTDLLHAYGNGRLSLDHYRGRSCFGFAVQAAEYFVRRATDTVGLAEVKLVERPVTRPDRLVARFLIPGGRTARVEVGRDQTPAAHRLTCGARSTNPIPRYELLALVIEDEAADSRPHK